jgi:uncharacterized delta-60 repeat protein
MNYRTTRTLLAFALVLTASSGSRAAGLDVDLSFGRVITPFKRVFGFCDVRTVASSINGLAIRYDDRILAAGDVAMTDGVRHSFGLALYDSGGKLDPSFGNHGQVITDMPTDILAQLPADAHLAGAAFGPLGDVTVVGSVTSQWCLGCPHVVVARYDWAGKLLGLAADLDLPTSAANAVALSPLQGYGLPAILVAGRANGTDAADFVLVRYLAPGLKDTTFGQGGVVLTDFGGEDEARSLALEPDGTILVYGTSRAQVAPGQFAYRAAFAAYDPNGKLIAKRLFGFGDPNGPFDANAAVLASPAGSPAAMLVGTSSYRLGDFYLAHLPDPTAQPSLTLVDFGDVIGNALNSVDKAFGAARDGQGRTIAVGRAGAPWQTSYFAVARTTGTASVERAAVSFGAFSTTEAHAVGVQSDDRVVVGGVASETPSFALTRFLP